jgi:acyl-CoA thioesterase
MREESMPEVTTHTELETSYSNARHVDPPETSGPSGGYLASLLLRGIESSLEDRRLRPRSVAVTYLRPTQFSSPLNVAVQTRSRGKTSAFYHAEGRQEEELRLTMEATYGLGSEGPRHQPKAIPSVPAPQDCPGLDLPNAMNPHFTQHCEYGLAPAPAPFSGAERADMLVWIRLRQRELDAPGMMFIMDAMFPPFYLAATRQFASPTTNLSVIFSSSFENQKAGAWLLARLSVLDWAGAWCMEEAKIWSREGELLARALHARRVFV